MIFFYFERPTVFLGKLFFVSNRRLVPRIGLSCSKLLSKYTLVLRVIRLRDCHKIEIEPPVEILAPLFSLPYSVTHTKFPNWHTSMLKKTIKKDKTVRAQQLPSS